MNALDAGLGAPFVISQNVVASPVYEPLVMSGYNGVCRLGLEVESPLLMYSYRLVMFSFRRA